MGGVGRRTEGFYDTALNKAVEFELYKFNQGQPARSNKQIVHE